MKLRHVLIRLVPAAVAVALVPFLANYFASSAPKEDLKLPPAAESKKIATKVREEQIAAFAKNLRSEAINRVIADRDKGYFKCQACIACTEKCIVGSLRGVLTDLEISGIIVVLQGEFEDAGYKAQVKKDERYFWLEVSWE